MINAFIRQKAYVVACLIIYCETYCDAAKILGVFPTPSISHQIAYRPLTQELAKRGHEVIVITPDPAFQKGQAPANLTEIDVHDLSYKRWRRFTEKCTGKKSDLQMQIIIALEEFAFIFENQMQTEEVKKLLNDKNQKFDLLLIEEIIRPTLSLSHKYKAPVISVSSFSSMFGNYADLGVPVHPLLYPTILNQRIYNLTVWEKINEFYNYLWRYNKYIAHEEMENELVKRVFGPETPALSELSRNVDMLFVNVHPIWDDNRPVPPNIIYMGGIHQTPEKKLPKDLESFLNASVNGVIYISFGTNVNPMFLPKELLQMFMNVFSELPYDVIWKWDAEDFEGKPKNIKLIKWLPQADLLRHPKIKLFITQGGLQSTDESITAGVPLIGLPMLADQWFNTEKYVQHQIGIQLDLETISGDKIKSAIKTVIEDESYRQNVIKLRDLVYDSPQKPLERAIWWVEHVLRHKGAPHLRSPAANLSWLEILEWKVVATIFIFITVIFISVTISAYLLYLHVLSKFLMRMKVKLS